MEKSSRKSREEREITDHKHQHRHHRSSKDHRHRHRNDTTEEDVDEEHRRRSRREKSLDEEEQQHDSRREREKKRKDREVSQERFDDKRIKVSDVRKERQRRFDDDNDNNNDNDGGIDKVDRREKRSDGKNDNSNGSRKRERRRFDDGDIKKDDVAEVAEVAATYKSGSFHNDGAVESLNVSSRFASEINPANNHTSTKVSSISTTNENKGVNITGSHEVTGKSSTDGTPSTAAKSGNISFDALAKAKKALQMQKELAEKLKKIPLLNRGTSSSNAVSTQVGSKEEIRASSATGVPPTSSTAAGLAAAGMMAAPSTFPAAASAKQVGMIDPAKFEAVKRAQELAAKMGFRQDTEFAPLINCFPGQSPPDEAVLQKPAKAPVLRLDALGREIDEHGNVVNISKPSNLSTLKVNINKQKKDAFLIHKPELEVDPETNPHYDPRMGIDKSKLLRPKRMTFQFVEEGKWSKDAEIIKLKSQFGEAQAKELKAKQAQLAKAKAEPNINPNLIEVSERVITKEKPKESIPEVEWW